MPRLTCVVLAMIWMSLTMIWPDLHTIFLLVRSQNARHKIAALMFSYTINQWKNWCLFFIFYSIPINRIHGVSLAFFPFKSEVTSWQNKCAILACRLWRCWYEMCSTTSLPRSIFRCCWHTVRKIFTTTPDRVLPSLFSRYWCAMCVCVCVCMFSDCHTNYEVSSPSTRRRGIAMHSSRLSVGLFVFGIITGEISTTCLKYFTHMYHACSA